MDYLLKVLFTALLVVLISELAKRSTLFGALLASVPLVSVLAMLWLYIDTRDTAKISAFSNSVFWLVLPSLVLFLVLPGLLKLGWSFYPSLGVSVVLTILSYVGLVTLLNFIGIKL